MARPFPRALLLLILLGPPAGAIRSNACSLGTYGAPLSDNPPQCPSRPETSRASSLHRARTSPGEARASDPPTKETSRSWILFGASAQKVTHSHTEEREPELLFLEGEECNRWIDDQVDPVETFSCPPKEEKGNLFCCGTCTASYCCPSQMKRLEQESCPKAIKGPEDQETEDLTGSVGTVTLLEFIFTAVGLCTIFSAFLCSLKFWMGWMEVRVERRIVNAQLDLVREVQAVPVIDTQPVRGTSAPPDLLTLQGAEYPNLSGNSIPEMRMSPTFARREEERETIL